MMGEDERSVGAPCTLLPDGYFEAEARAVFAEVAEQLLPPEQRRVRIAQRMRAGEALSRADQAFAIACVTGEIDAPAPRRRGRPPKTGLTVEKWRQAAVIQFYRRLLPKFDKTRERVKLAVFERAFKYGDDASIRELEGVGPLTYPKDEQNWRFREVIDLLIRAEGLPLGTHYCVVSNALKGPIVGVWPR